MMGVQNKFLYIVRNSFGTSLERLGKVVISGNPSLTLRYIFLLFIC